MCAVSIKNDIFPPLLTVSQLLTVSHQKLTLPNLLTPTFNFICYNGPSVLSALFTVPDKPKAPAAAILVASGVGFIHPVHRETGGRRAEVRRTERTSRHHGPDRPARSHLAWQGPPMALSKIQHGFGDERRTERGRNGESDRETSKKERLVDRWSGNLSLFSAVFFSLICVFLLPAAQGEPK